VQDDHGGSVKEHKATKKEILFAEHCLKACPFKPIYARIDIVYDNNNELSLSEIELIEPELWLRNNPTCADIFASEILKLISLK
jgi:hypothetical protein